MKCRHLPPVALVGCGAVAKELYLPALKRYENLSQALTLVDTNRANLEVLSGETGAKSTTNLDAVLGEVDAAIIATPHHLHAPIAAKFLRANANVLVEKPLAPTVAEVIQVLNEAEKSGKVVMTNNCRRVFYSYTRVASILHSGELGNIKRIRLEEGGPFEWNSVSGFYVNDTKNARGVLLDLGAHAVDILCWWLRGQPTLCSSRSDSFGGAEAVCDLEMEMNGHSISMRFSRLFRLVNRYKIDCDLGSISGQIYDWNKFTVTKREKSSTVDVGPRGMVFKDFSALLLENFVNVVKGICPPLFQGKDVLPSIAVIENAYKEMKPFELPWYSDLRISNNE